MRPHEMTATALAAALRRGDLGSEALVRDCLDRIAALEERVQAWTHLDAGRALADAREADARRAGGAPLGPLHGIPVGVKDIFDTADMPTENGTVLHAGRRPREDAAAVTLLRQAGAIILGKTVTTELAVYAPGKTTNPHDARRTPGGSSSGSAAAVATSMVPLAIGTQTNGSVIRPASYCGVVGFKPSHGAISRHGVLKQSRTLDHVGVFARTVDDVALVSRPLFAADGRDPDVPPGTRLDVDADVEPIERPRLAFVRSPLWDNATASAKRAFARLVAAWDLAEIELSPAFANAVDWHRTIMESDLASSYAGLYESGRERISAMLREMIERGQRYTGVAYSRAQDGALALRRELDDVFGGIDAIVTPATTGEAPLGLDYTGSPMFCTAWTLCGVPAITLPLLEGDDGMPIGVQLVAAKGDDGRLLRVAKALAQRKPPVARA